MSRRYVGKRRPSLERRGIAAVVALACAAIVIAIMGNMIQEDLRAVRQMRQELGMRQTERLLEAGVERALHRARNEPGYDGETWELASDQITSGGGGRVQIVVEAHTRQVRVCALYPLAANGRELLANRRSRVFKLPQTSSPAEE